MNDLERLIAIDDIKQLKAQYFWYVGSKNSIGLKALFTVDAEVETEGRKRDLNNFMAHIGRQLANRISVHHGHMPIISLDSPNAAKATWAMGDEIWLSPRIEAPQQQRYWRGSGHGFGFCRDSGDGPK